MKVVFLSDDFPPQSFGGAGISTYDLARGMQKAGHEIFVITTCRKRELAGTSHADGLTIHTILSNYDPKWRWYISLNNKSTVVQVEALLSEIQPDIVHINNVHFYLSYHCFKLAKKYARGTVFTARDVM
jgi:glycosyltransferase involved in cell wall biosynthesis